jgi:hypothetical protein
MSRARATALGTLSLMFIASPLTVAGEALKPGVLAGVWQIETPISRLQSSDGRAPPLRPAAKAQYEQRQQQLARGERNFDATQRCKPMGLPRSSYDPEAGPLEIVLHPTVVVFGYTWNRMVRFAYVRDTLPEVLGPTYYGTATARWVGEELVLTTRGFHDSTLLDAAGMPHSDELQLVERYRLRDNGTRLLHTLQITDAKTFTRPWQASFSYRRLPAARIAEDHCIERLKITDY